MSEEITTEIGKATINVPSSDKSNFDNFFYMNVLKKSNSTKARELAEKIQKILEYEINIMLQEDNKEIFDERKSNFVNCPIELDNNHIGYFNTIVENNSMLPYMLIFPKKLNNNAEMIVDTLNTRDTENTDQREGAFIQGVQNIMSYININAPMIYIFIPNRNNQNEPYYQQLSRECFTNEKRKYDRIDLMVKKCILSAQKKVENFTQSKISNKVVLNGHSTSGVFAQRFALLHPEIISKTIIGGAIGSIPMPTEDLEYPLGIKDFEKLFGKKFDIEEYKKIDFAYIVGEEEPKETAIREDENKNKIIVPMHDMSYMQRSVPTEIGKKYRDMYGEDLQNRFLNCISWYKNNGFNIISKIYKGASHSLFDKNYIYLKHLIRDMFAFYKSGIKGTGFKKDIASADTLDMDFQKKEIEKN